MLRSITPLFAILSGCSDVQVQPGEELFRTGSSAELLLAQDLAWDALDQQAAALGVTADIELRARKVVIDEEATAHLRLQQELDGVPVFGGEAIVHLHPDGRFRGFTDALVRDLAVDTTPALTADDAIDGVTDWSVITEDPRADLVVLRHEGADHLAWRVQLERLDGSAESSKPVIFVDAHDGAVIWSYDNLQTGATTGTGTGTYSGSISFNSYQSGSSYYLEDSVRGLGTYTYNSSTTSAAYCTDADNAWTASTQYAQVEAHAQSARVYDYYYNTFARDGIDGAGGPGNIASLTGTGKVISSFANYGRNYANAFWSSPSMYYGDGDGSTFGPLVTTDIAGHEMTHGVTENEANLTYSGESGGLNEAFSDIFGAMVEAYADGAVSANTWLIGEDTYTPGTSGDALRYMNDPAADGVSYDYYSSSMGSADVHYTSGVANLAFYLLSEGGNHPTRGGTAMTGIGHDKAAAIFYRALTTYLTASSNYAAARTATINAATDLYGASSAEVTAVGAAWSLVGVGGSSSGGSGTCSGTTATGTISKAGSSVGVPSTSGWTSTASGTTSASMTGPSGANFDLYLQKKSAGKKWTTVASSTGTTSTESLSASTTAGTYRLVITAKTGSGAYTVCYSKP